MGVLTQVPLTAEALSITGPNPARCRVFSVPSSHTQHFFNFFFFFFLLYQKELGFGLAAAFLAYLNNPIGQLDKAVNAVVMFLLFLT